MPPQNLSDPQGSEPGASWPGAAPGLAEARGHLREAQAKLKYLKRSFNPKPERPPGDWALDWNRLRRRLESLIQLTGDWAPAREDAETRGDADWRRRRREMDARSLRVESALREVEEKQEALDLDRQRTLAELERVREGWRLLREETHGGPEALPEGTLPALISKAQGLTELWENLMSREAQTAREYERVERLWRWIYSVSLPTLEEKAVSGPEAPLLPTLRRLLEDLDRRWRQLQNRVKKVVDVGFIPVERKQRHELAEAIARGDKLAQEGEALRERLDARSADKDSRIAELEKQVEGFQTSLQKGRTEIQFWRDLCEASRRDLDGLMAQISVQEEKQRAAETSSRQQSGALQSHLGQTRTWIEELQKKLDRSQEEFRLLRKASEEQKMEWEAELKAAQSGAGPLNIPALGSAPEPSWGRVLESLREPLETAYTQLRRLAASQLPEGPRLVAKLAVGSLAQASDTLKAVGEFLDDAGPAPSAGKLIATVEAALAPWESAFRQRQSSIVRSFEREMPLVVVQAESLRIAVYHIIRNAYEAMPPSGGCLTIKIGVDPSSGQPTASFADTGPGFSAKALEQIFVPFHSTKPRHLGLGLALVRRVMRRCSGEAEAGNNANRGAIVTLRFTAPDESMPKLRS